MKIKTLVLVALLCVEMVSAQQFRIPIGSHADDHEATVGIAIGGGGVRAGESFSYEPTMGTLETVVRTRLWKIAEGFTAPAGFEESTYFLYVIVEPGPIAILPSFNLSMVGNRWVIPTEVMNVELEYGSVRVPAPGVTGVEVEVRGSGRTEKFSTIARTGGTSCEIDTTLGGTFVVIHRRFAVPKYRELWWTEGEVTLWEGEQWARFTMEGEFIDSSPVPPAFLEQLKVAPAPPRITSIQRIGEFTEIFVSVPDGTEIVLEFKADLQGEWVAVDRPTVSKMSAGSRTITQTNTNACGFYRVKVLASPTLKSLVPVSKPTLK